MATLPLGESLDISLKTQSRHFINPQIKKIDDCYCLSCPVRLLCISRASYAARSAGQEAAFGLLYPSTQMGIDSSRFSTRVQVLLLQNSLSSLPTISRGIHRTAPTLIQSTRLKTRPSPLSNLLAATTSAPLAINRSPKLKNLLHIHLAIPNLLYTPSHVPQPLPPRLQDLIFASATIPINPHPRLQRGLRSLSFFSSRSLRLCFNTRSIFTKFAPPFGFQFVKVVL